MARKRSPFTPAYPATDQRGFARIGPADIGAAEFQGAADLRYI